MNTVDVAHDLLGVVPIIVSERGMGQPITAYYTDVPMQALPATCHLAPTDTGFVLEGKMGDYSYQGNLISGSDPTRFRRAVVSFLYNPQTVVVH